MVWDHLNSTMTKRPYHKTRLKHDIFKQDDFVLLFFNKWNIGYGLHFHHFHCPTFELWMKIWFFLYDFLSFCVSLIYCKRVCFSSRWSHLFYLLPMCVYKCFLRILASEDDTSSHWWQYFGFPPLLCHFKCRLKSPAWIDAKSHWLHLFVFSPLCVFKCVLRWCA